MGADNSLKSSESFNTFEAISWILKRHPELFYGDESLARYNYSIRQVHSTNLVRELSWWLIDLPPHQEIIRASIIETRKNDGHWTLKEYCFFHYDGYIIPLWTHKYPNRASFYAYNSDTLEQVKLSDYIIWRLPWTVRLTRTLGIDEVEIFEKRNMWVMGSIRKWFWDKKCIHTALHDWTNEHVGKGYERSVWFIFDKSTIEKLVREGKIEIGTYEFIFKDRSADAPFPFDMEFVFNEEAFGELLVAYLRWKTTTWCESVLNPFYKKQ